MKQLTEKQPYEEYYIYFNFDKEFSDQGDTSITVDSVVVEDADTGEVVTSSLYDSTKDLTTGLRAYVWVKGGVSGKSYKYTCKVIGGQSGEKYEKEGLLPVQEK